MNVQSYDSPVWKALAYIWEDFQSHVLWQIGDGRNANFWLDKWSPNNGSLMSITNQTFMDTTLSVRDVLTRTGDWDLYFHNTNLMDETVSRILTIMTPTSAWPCTIG